jgi:hypothetical protein
MKKTHRYPEQIWKTIGGIELKNCCACHKWLPATKKYFPGNSGSLDGLNARCKACYREARLIQYWRFKQSIFAEYGGKCNNPAHAFPITDIRLLTIDHIHGGGAKHRKSINIKGGHSFYRWLKRNNFPKNKFQVLCYNCNQYKKITGRLPSYEI